MASNQAEPSSSSAGSPQPTDAEVQLASKTQFCDQSTYVNAENVQEFQSDAFVSQFKPEDHLISYSHCQFNVDPTDSADSSSYVQKTLVHHGEPSGVVSSDAPSPPVLSLQEESVDSHQSQEAEAVLERISLDPSCLQHISVLHHNVPGLPALPIILDSRNGLAALITTSRADGSLCLDTSSLPRSVISSQTLPQRTLLTADQAQFLAADPSLVGMNHNLLSPMLAQRDALPSLIAASSSAPAPSLNQAISSSYPLTHKQILVQKYAAELEAPSTSASLIADMREQQLIESISERVSSPYVVASSSGGLVDSQSMQVFEDHVISSLPSTSVSQCLPIDVYSIDRGVALVSSSRDSPENMINGDVEFSSVTNASANPTVQNYVSSSVDLVQPHHIEHAVHCAVDSTVGPKLHPSEENVVDSSNAYGEHVDTSDDVLHTTSRAEVYSCHIAEVHSCGEVAADDVLTRPGLEANEALSTTSQVFSSHTVQFHDSTEDVQGCSTVSSATHPDSTHSPDMIREPSPNLVVHSEVHLDSSEVDNPESSRPRRDPRSSKHWCDDCGVFYEKECPQHRIQLIFDKPVLSRAWASLPATYLYVNKIGNEENGEPVYGVFAKKTIPKRTQFGPVEGVLLKCEEQLSESFQFIVGQENSALLYLDTSNESMSNWMRFVRPAETHKEQNLVLVHQGTSLYFNTTRSINPKNELRVWYSSTYAMKWKLPLLEPDEEERRALAEEENAWPCFECNQRFPSSVDLQKHLNQHDDTVGEINTLKGKTKAKARPKVVKKAPRLKVQVKQEEYKCEICYKVFPRNYSLQRHLIMHSGEKKYKCPICDMRFSHVYNRNRHVRRHKQKEEGEETSNVPKRPKSLFRKKQGAEWICTHCDLTFDNSNVLNLHTLTHAAEDVGMNENYIDGRYMSEDGLDGGSSENSKIGEEEPHKCPECTQGFACKRDLIEHASVHGKVGKQRCYRGVINPLKPFKCNLCYKSFATDERLIRHYLVHGSEDSKPLQCDICFKRFLNNSALACHIKVHSEEKKFYECPICKMEFDQIMALRDHVHVHCSNGVYNCPHCHKVFEEYNQIRKHIRAFHSERRYPCDKCEKIFPRPDKLKLHMLRHSDHREFLCANCGKQFKRKDKLKEHMKRMHAPEREDRINARNSKSTGSKKFVPKVSPTDYHRFIYKCHSCLLGFKRRGMLVNHLAKRHPDIRPESVPELNLPILKTTRDYYCQYCEKVYKSSSKRKAHILKNHPGQDLPMSNRRKGGVPDIPGIPNPTFSQTVGSITTHPHHCSWCHKQYASKAKLLQHQRKKHMEMLALSYVAAQTKVESVCEQGTQVNSQVLIESVGGTIMPEAAAVLIAGPKGKIRYIDGNALVTADTDVIPTADLLTQAMSELTQNFVEYRSSPGEFLSTRLSQSTSTNTTTNPSPSITPDPTPPTSISTPSSPSISETTITAPALDQIQLNQLLAQYQQQQSLSTQQLAAVVVSVSRAWPTGVTATVSNYPAR